MKPQAKEFLLSDDETENSVPKIVSSETTKENVRSILKSSPKKENEATAKGAGRAAMISGSQGSSREEKRIQFHIVEDEQKEDKKESGAGSSSEV